MTEKEREKLIVKMAKAAWRIGEEVVLEWDQANENVREVYLKEARAALAVAEPVIREQCARIAETGSFPINIDVWVRSTKKEMTANMALVIAAAIREGGG